MLSARMGELFGYFAEKGKKNNHDAFHFLKGVQRMLTESTLGETSATVDSSDVYEEEEQDGEAAKEEEAATEAQRSFSEVPEIQGSHFRKSAFKSLAYNAPQR